MLLHLYCKKVKVFVSTVCGVEHVPEEIMNFIGNKNLLILC